MRRRIASIDDLPIAGTDRKVHCHLVVGLTSIPDSQNSDSSFRIHKPFKYPHRTSKNTLHLRRSRPPRPEVGGYFFVIGSASQLIQEEL